MHKIYLINKNIFLKLNQDGGYIDNTNIKNIYTSLKLLPRDVQNDMLHNLPTVKDQLSITDDNELYRIFQEQVERVNKLDDENDRPFPNLLPLVTNNNSINEKLNIFTEINDNIIVQVYDNVVNGMSMLLDDKLILNSINTREYEIFEPTEIIIIDDDHPFENIKGNPDFNFNLYIYDNSLVKLTSSLFKNFTIFKTIKNILNRTFYEHSEYHKYMAYGTFLSQFFNYRIDAHSIKPHKINTILSTFIMMNNINLLFDLVSEPMNNILDVKFKILRPKITDEKHKVKVREVSSSVNKMTKPYSVKMEDNIYINFKKKIEKLIPIDKVIHLYNHVIQANTNVLHNIDIDKDPTFRYYTDRVLLNEKNLYELFIYELYNFINKYQMAFIHSQKDKIPSFCKDIIYYYLVKTYKTSNTLKNKFLFIDLLNNISIEERFYIESKENKNIFNNLTNMFLLKHDNDPIGFKINNYIDYTGISYDGRPYAICVETTLINIINYILPRNEEGKLILTYMLPTLVKLYESNNNFPIVDNNYLTNIQAFINLLSNIPNVVYKITNPRTNLHYNIVATENNLYNCLLYLFNGIPEDDKDELDTLVKLLKYLNDDNNYTVQHTDYNKSIIINNKYSIYLQHRHHTELKYYNANVDRYENKEYNEYNESINNIFKKFNTYNTNIIDNFINIINNSDDVVEIIQIKNILFNDLNFLVPYNENLLNGSDEYDELRIIYDLYNRLNNKYPFLIDLLCKIDYEININKINNIFALFIITSASRNIDIENIIIQSNLNSFINSVFLSDFVFFGRVSLIEYSLFSRTHIISRYLLSDTNYTINLLKIEKSFTPIHMILYDSNNLEILQSFLSYYVQYECMQSGIEYDHDNRVYIMSELKLVAYDKNKRIIYSSDRTHIQISLLMQALIINENVYEYLFNSMYGNDSEEIRKDIHYEIVNEMISLNLF
jgi:hypothetical protein